MSTFVRNLEAVPFTQVSLDDPFWAPRLEVNRQATIPHAYEMCERTGRLAAWDLSWKPGDPNPPHIFWDSDVAKWLEAASHALATRYEARLDAQLDALIAKMARAQSPDGYPASISTVCRNKLHLRKFGSSGLVSIFSPSPLPTNCS